MTKDDDETTPVDRAMQRRSTGSLTSWGLIETWLETDRGRTVTHSSQSERGHVVLVRDSTGKSITESVRGAEDPSAAIVRAIAELT